MAVCRSRRVEIADGQGADLCGRQQGIGHGQGEGENKRGREINLQKIIYHLPALVPHATESELTSVRGTVLFGSSECI